MSPMSWTDRLHELRNGSLNLATAAEGQFNKLLRRTSFRAEPRPPTKIKRFEPRSTADSASRAASARIAHGRSVQSGPTPAVAEPTKNQPSPRHREVPATSVRSRIQAAHVDRLRAFNTGERIGDELQVSKVLTRGPFFDTYLARHLTWEMDVAVKVPKRDLLAAEGGLPSIAEAAAQWTALGLHSHIVYCYALEVLDGVPVLLLEHASGGDLRTRLKHGFSTGLRLALSLGIQLCHALEHAHANGFWHGAVTPENLLFTADGSLLLSDLGIAARCQALSSHAEGEPTACNTQRYLAPERRNSPYALDARTDIFSLGVCLHDTLCSGISNGPVPYTRLDPADARLSDGSKMPDRLARLLADCAARDVAQRPASVADVRHELCAIYKEQFLRPSPQAQLRPATWQADGWNNQALVACWLGRDEEATTAWDDALGVTPGHIESTYNRALMRWRCGEISDEDALREIEELLDPHTRAEQVAHLLGLVHLERGDTASAIRFLERAAAHLPADDEVSEALQSTRSAPNSAANRRELTGHDGFVSAVALHPENQWVLSAGDDGRLIVWDAPQGRPVRVLPGHLERLSSVSLNGDGSLVVSASDDATLKVWDTQNGTCLMSLATVGSVFAVACSADGRRAVSSSSGTNNFLGVDNTVLQVWDVEKERCIGELVGHTSAAKTLALTADGQTAISAGDDHTVRIWDLSRLTCLRVLRGHQHFVTSVCVTPDGGRLLSASWDQTVRLWDPTSGECVRVLRGTKTIVTCVAVSGDGRTAASGCWDGSVRLWDVDSGRCIRTFAGHSRMVTGVAVSTDGRTVVSGSWDGTVRVWNLARARHTCALRWSQRQ